MRDMFPAYYRPSEKELTGLLQNSVFVVDANVLLNLYRFPATASNDLLSLLETLSGNKQLWIPHQVALEFQQNRLAVIAEQKNRFTEVKKIISQLQQNLRTGLDDLQLRKRHSSIDPDVLIDQVNVSFQDYIKKLEKLESWQADVHHDDKIRDNLDKILTGHIGQPFSQEELNKICEEGRHRFARKQSPGWGDQKKKEGTHIFHDGLVIQREYGDLIVWKQILKYVNEKKILGVVFVTDDTMKDDWWHSINGKTIGPKPDLVSEVYKETNVKSFLMYNSERFLEIVSKHLKIEISKESVEQVKDVVERPLMENPNVARMILRYELLGLYEGMCQVCNSKTASTVPIRSIFIKPPELGGKLNLDNSLLLCTRHHNLFATGSFSIAQDFSLIGLDGNLIVHPLHRIDLNCLEYHRSHIYKSEHLDFEESEPIYVDFNPYRGPKKD